MCEENIKQTNLKERLENLAAIVNPIAGLIAIPLFIVLMVWQQLP